MSAPLVSVIVPNYNHAPYLRERLDSILAQTFQDFELIVLDDGSSDDSRELIREYAARYPGIRCEFNHRNSGSPYAQWNKGVEQARGKLIWIAESDDRADPEFLDHTTAALHQNPGVGIVYSDSMVVEDRRPTEERASDWKVNRHGARWLSDYVAGGKEEISNFLFLHNTINNASAALMRRAAYLKVGGADASLKYCGDWDLYIRILLESDIAFLRKPLNSLRRHAGSSFHDYAVSERYLLEVVKVYGFILGKIPLSPRKRRAMTGNLLLLLASKLRRGNIPSRTEIRGAAGFLLRAAAPRKAPAPGA